jgi:tripartite-type tricarboxylate transporter receptor subunit TctC
MLTHAFASLLAAVALSGAAAAQAEAAYPTKPVRLVVPFAAGGGGDITSRLVAQGMSKHLGQNVLVDNKPGAAGQLGIDLVAKSPADGYTIVFGSAGPLTVTPNFRPLPYDPLTDFTPVGMMATTDGVVVVHKDFPAKNPKEFIALVKANPMKYSYGTSGTAGPSHLSGERFQIATGTQLQHIGYRGDGPAIADLVGGQIPIVFTLTASVMQQINAGTIRAVASYGEKRSSLFPDLPTFVETGYPDLTYNSWFALYGPKGLASDVVAKLNAALKAALSDSDLAARLAALGIEPAYSTAQQLAVHTAAEFERNRKVIRERNLKIEE